MTADRRQVKGSSDCRVVSTTTRAGGTAYGRPEVRCSLQVRILSLELDGHTSQDVSAEHQAVVGFCRVCSSSDKLPRVAIRHLASTTQRRNCVETTLTLKDDDNLETMITLKSWRFMFDGGHTIDVECLTRPYASMKVPCPSVFNHGDLEMFARGWVACRDYA